MKKQWIAFLLVLPLLFNFTSKDGNGSKIRFVKNNLDQVKRRAAAEGKPFFVDFMASWCMPCRWMEETTFSDPNLTEFVNKNYLAVKVDVDDFDGYAYKQQYDIKMLPSIMVFSPDGKVMARYQESMSPSKLLTELKKYQIKNATPVAPSLPPPTAPVAAVSAPVITASPVPPPPAPPMVRPQVAASRVSAKPVTNASSTEKPVVNINISVTGNTDQPLKVTAPNRPPVTTYEQAIPLDRPPSISSTPTPVPPPPAPRPQRPVITPAPPAAKPPTYVYSQPANERPSRVKPPVAGAPTPMLPSGDGLYRLSVARQLSSGFSVQTGVFGDYQNVLREVDKLQKMFDQPVIVHVDSFKGQRVYKVMIGQFEDRGAAVNYLSAIKYRQVVGFVQDLSTMQ